MILKCKQITSVENLNKNNSIIPPNIRAWLHDRGITDQIITHRNLSTDSHGNIVIPIYDIESKHLFNKTRRNPFTTTGPKYSYDKGGSVALYAIDNLYKSKSIIICEGEFDAMVLEANGFPAVTSTGGASSFQESWALYFLDKDVYVRFDHDKAGYEGMKRVSKIIPHAKWIPFPPDMKDHSDITDYFTVLKKTADDFRSIMKVAEPIELEEDAPKETKKKSKKEGDTNLQKAKSVPLDVILKFNHSGFASCPMHTDKTPSLKWYPGSNRWKCYSCGKHGDSVDLIMAMYEVDIKEAIQILINKF